MVLSIIIPHYNDPALLEKLLMSIEFNDSTEVIVVDDHSNEQIEQFNLLKKRFNKVNFLVNDKDKKGAGSARNKGLEASKAKWILFADSDDFFIKGYFQIVCEYLDSLYEIVFFKPTSVELGTNIPSNRHLMYQELVEEAVNDDDIDFTNLRLNFVSPCSKLIKRDFITSHQLRFENVIAGNDVMFSIKANFKAEKIAISNNVIYCITKSPGTLTQNNSKIIFYTRLGVFIRMYHYLQTILPKSKFLSLNLYGSKYLRRAIKNKYSIKDIFKVYFILKKNKIPVLHKGIFLNYHKRN